MKQQENIMRLVEKYQYKKSICYPKTNERIYCNLRIFYIISYAYLIVFGIILALGIKFVTSSPTYYLVNTVASLVLYTVAFVLMFFKLDLISLLINIIATVLKFSPLKDLLILNSGAVDIKPAFYWQHLLPVVLLFIVSIWMTKISATEKYLIKRDTKKVINNLYERFHTDDMTEEEWETFLKNYKTEEND